MAEKFSEWMSLTVAEIKELLKSVDLPTSGKKEQMVERIIDYYNENIRDLYRSMTIAELKELLKASGLPTSGKRQDLVERLFETSPDRIIDDRPSVVGPVAPPMAPATSRVSLPLELLPDNEFIVKDWGINPYDPTASYQGFMNLSQKERKRLFQEMESVISEIRRKGSHDSIITIVVFRRAVANPNGVIGISLRLNAV
jgi:hypothetical protein